MSTNKGKEFELIIRNTFEKCSEDVSVDRLNDQMSGFKQSSCNICDFIAYSHPYQYYIECKTIKDKYFPLCNITETQFSGMIQKIQKKGVVAGIILWFNSEDITVFIDILTLWKLKMAHYSSVKLSKILDGEIDHIVLPSVKKRTYCEYDGQEILRLLKEYSDSVWEELK